MDIKKIWSYTKVQYLDDRMYELAEYMPNSILEDAEYITEKEFKHLYKLYSNSNQEILLFLKIIFECGTCDSLFEITFWTIKTLILSSASDLLDKNIDKVKNQGQYIVEQELKLFELVGGNYRKVGEAYISEILKENSL